MSRKRQQQQSEEVRQRILTIARRILSEEGAEALSLRKITDEMEYSAGIIYHYFESKDDILICLLREGYQGILESVRPPDPSMPPDEAIRTAFMGYLRNGLAHPAEYKAMMLSSMPQVLEFTSVLGEGDCEKRLAFKGLLGSLEAGVKSGMFAPCDMQITAQALWSAMFGLLIRLIIEQSVSPEHINKIAERQIELLLKGLMP